MQAHVGLTLSVWAFQTQRLPALLSACQNILRLQLATPQTSSSEQPLRTFSPSACLQQGFASHSSSYARNSSPIHLSSTVSSPLSEEHEFVGAYTPVTKRLWLERLRMAKQSQQTEQNQAVDASTVTKLPQVTTVEYPFTTDNLLYELYRNPWGFLRMGRLLEDLDSLAGSIAFQHCWIPGAPPPHLVTVAVDAIEYSHPVSLDTDMVCQGQVVFTGGSSMDIRMELLQAPHAPAPSLVALFSFVLLDATTKKPAKAPALQPSTPQEQAWAAERAEVAAARKAARTAAKSSGGQPALPQEQQQYLQSAIAASSLLVDMPALADPLAITAEATSLSNTFICQPQQRNMHGRVFGGFLMRRVFELAFSTTYLFAGTRPSLVRVDDITFKSPVDVGSLLRFKSFVVDVSYSNPGQAQIAVEVEAVVSQPEQKTTRHTNRFRYVFGAAALEGQKLRRVLPATPNDVDRLINFLRND